MDILLDELAAGIPDARGAIRVVLRLVVAALLASIIGIERGLAGKPAGIRTHMLVTLGSALFVAGAIESGFESDSTSRVLQGIITGIGFVGGGAILKLTRRREIQGLTTAASLWMAAAIGVSCGLGRFFAAAAGAAVAWIILRLLGELERGRNGAPPASPKAPH